MIDQTTLPVMIHSYYIQRQNDIRLRWRKDYAVYKVGNNYFLCIPVIVCPRLSSDHVTNI